MKPVTNMLKKLKQHFSGKQQRKGIDMRDISEREDDIKQTFFVSDLEQNLRRFEEITGKSYDITILRIFAGPDAVPVAVIYIDGMADKDSVDSLLYIVEIETLKVRIRGIDKKNIFETLKTRLVTHENHEVRDMHALYAGIALGDTAIFFDGTAKALLLETKGWEVREIMEPESETTIRGSRDGFVENIRTNTSLIRRRIQSPNLWIENIKLGSLTNTNVAFAYMKGLAGEEMLEELRSRLESIDIDGVLESGVVEEYIRDNPYSLFPDIFRTERPDRVAGALLEGRAAVFTNGTPFVLVLPADLPMFLQATDDYNELFPIGSFIRVLRFFAFIISIFLPGIYVALLNFHPELLPIPLMITIQAAREGVPFPVVAEVIFMEAAFEVLREAGIRLPRAIGSAISIVGALILGEAAIRAGLVSPGVVIIVAFTAIASFSAPVFSIAITARLLRFGMLFLGAAFGLFGIQFGLLAMLIHLVSLRSFGHPYLAPYGPFIWRDMKDSILRTFWWGQVHRPKLLGYREPVRQRTGQQPRAGKGNRPGRKGGNARQNGS